MGDCWKLLERADFGRLAVRSFDGMPDVFPLNYRATGGFVYVRSAPGGKLRSIARNPTVAFEVDGEDVGFRWSVVVRGTAERMSIDADIEASGVLSLISASPTGKQNFLRLTPKTVSGRRFRTRLAPPTRGGLLHAPEAPLRDDASRADKPVPIPHLAPHHAENPRNQTTHH